MYMRAGQASRCNRPHSGQFVRAEQFCAAACVLPELTALMKIEIEMYWYNKYLSATNHTC
jgi:hypothetical protein